MNISLNKVRKMFNPLGKSGYKDGFVNSQVCGSLTEPTKRFAWLDVLRFISCIIVFFAHCIDNTNFRSINIVDFGDHYITYYLLKTGGVGVCIFFLISGYIIPFAISRQKNIKTFLINRCFRIFPLFLLTLIVYRLTGLKFNPLSILLPFANFANIPHAINIDWTLRIEFLFYIVISILFFKFRLNIKNIFILQVGIFLFGVSVKYIAPSFVHLIASVCYMNYILLGTYFVLDKAKIKDYLMPTIGLVITLSSRYIFAQPYKTLFIFTGFIIFCLGYALRNKINDTKITRLLGDITYPLYLTHSILFKPLYKLTHSIEAALFILFLICYLLHTLVEKPAIKYGRRFCGS